MVVSGTATTCLTDSAIQDALHIVSTDVILKAVIPNWAMKLGPTKRIRNVVTAFDELEVRFWPLYAYQYGQRV